MERDIADLFVFLVHGRTTQLAEEECGPRRCGIALKRTGDVECEWAGGAGYSRSASDTRCMAAHGAMAKRANPRGAR